VVNSAVLVLNQSYEPLNVCQARRAVVLLYRGKAELLEDGRGEIRSVSQAFPLPSVIRLIYLIKHHRAQCRLSRLEVFSRDRFVCQYCGRETRQLTLDHVIPRHQGGQHVWENVVSACIPCNHRKAGRTPEQARMRLIRQPRAPGERGYLIPYHCLRHHQEWHKYVPYQGG